MNIINSQIQVGITYTLSPILYPNQHPIPLFNSRFHSDIIDSRYTNLETSYKQLSYKCSILMQQNQQLKNILNQSNESNPLAQQSTEKKTQPNSIKRLLVRRKQDELEKKYKCYFGKCKKQYASTLALNLHVKTKHQGGTKKQMDDLAKKIVEAEEKGEENPSQFFKLPQGYLQAYRKQHSISPHSGY